MLAAGTRFAHILIRANNDPTYHIYHVVSATPTFLLLMRSTLFGSDIHGKGNELIDNLLNECESRPILKQLSAPQRYMLEKDNGYDYFVIGKNTDNKDQRVCLNGDTNPVTFIRVPDETKNGRKRAATY